MSSHVPLLLQASDFEAQFPLQHSPECDCACPDNRFSVYQLPLSQGRVYKQAILHTQTLSSEYTLAFNPLRGKGLIVLNQTAKKILDEFKAPRSPDTFETHFRSLVQEMFLAGLLEPVETRVHSRIERPQTLTAWLHVTNECNLRCDYCYISKTDDSMSPKTGFAAVDAIIRSAGRGNFKRIKLKFAGGEATLNLKLVIALHDYAVEQTGVAGLELDSVILSNGVVLGERAITELERCGIRVMISLDGVGETHDAQRKFRNGRGSFAWTSRTLDRLMAQGIKPFISITITDRNVDGLPEVVSYVLERDLPFNINFFRDNECAASFDDLQMREDRLIEAMFRVFDVIEANLPTHSLLGSLVDRSQFDQPHDKTCGVGESYLVVDHHGHIAKCHMEIEKPVTDVYADDPLAFIRIDQIGIQNVSVEEKEGCRDCEWKYWCTGGCPLLTYRATGRFDVKSPYCRVYKTIYPRLLRLEGLRLLKLNGTSC